MSDRPEVVTLCGSTRFKEQFEAETRRLTLEGRIVISVGLFGHIEGLDIGTDEEPSAVKVMLDELHLRKIDLADRVHVINLGGYVGTSTGREVAYSRRTGKQVTYMDPCAACPPCPSMCRDDYPSCGGPFATPTEPTTTKPDGTTPETCDGRSA